MSLWHHRIDSCSYFISFYSLLTLLLIYQDPSCLTNTAVAMFIRRVGGPPLSLWNPLMEVLICPYLASDVFHFYGYISGTQPKVLFFFLLLSFIHDFDFVSFSVSMLRCQLSRLRSQIYFYSHFFFIFIYAFFSLHGIFVTGTEGLISVNLPNHIPFPLPSIVCSLLCFLVSHELPCSYHTYGFKDHVI